MGLDSWSDAGADPVHRVSVQRTAHPPREFGVGTRRVRGSGSPIPDGQCGRLTGVAAETVGLVLAGAAARGPYQAGALSVLLPALEAEGHRPVVLLGTSSGGISSALVAQFADLPAAEAGSRIVDTWTGFGDVFRNPLLRPAPAASLIARLLGAGFVPPVTSILDVTPLQEHAASLFHPERVAANIASGAVRSLAVATTVCPVAHSAARSRLFVQGQAPGDDDPNDGVDVVATPITL